MGARDQKEKRGATDQRDQRDPRGVMVIMEKKVTQDRLGPKVTPDQKATRDTKVTLDQKATRDTKVTPDQKATPVPLDPKVYQG